MSKAFENACRFLKESPAHSVKLEGGVTMAETISYLTTRGVPVMGHIGLMPQSVYQMGGYRIQGRVPVGTGRFDYFGYQPQTW